MLWGLIHLYPKMYYTGTRGGHIRAIGGSMRASRWGLYEKYLAQNKTTIFVLDKLLIQISIPIG